MNMREQLQKLAELSQIEAQIKLIEGELERVPADAQKAQDGADNIKGELDGLERTHLDAESERRRLEGDLQMERGNLRKWQARLDNIRDEREHSALLSEMGTQKRGIRALENKILDAMENLEALAGDIAKLRPDYEKALEEAQGLWGEVDGELSDLRSEKNVRVEARDARIELLAPAVVARYRRIAERRQTGVTIIKDETCQSCFRSIPPQLVLQVYRGEIMEGCPSCQRIMIHESFIEADETPAQESIEDEGANAAAAPA